MPNSLSTNLKVNVSKVSWHLTVFRDLSPSGRINPTPLLVLTSGSVTQTKQKPQNPPWNCHFSSCLWAIIFSLDKNMSAVSMISYTATISRTFCSVPAALLTLTMSWQVKRGQQNRMKDLTHLISYKFFPVHPSFSFRKVKCFPRMGLLMPFSACREDLTSTCSSNLRPQPQMVNPLVTPPGT